MSEYELTKIEYIGDRIESGPIQIGDDWPGIFMRGDYALPTAYYLSIILQEYEKSNPEDVMFTMYVKDFIMFLSSCNMNNHR